MQHVQPRRQSAVKSSMMAAILLLVVLLLAACTAAPPQGAESAEPAEDEVVQLTFRQNDPPNEVGDLFERALDEFNEMHPNIQVNLETVPWSDAQNQYVREVQAGGGPDVAQMAFVWTRDLATADLVTNLDSYVWQWR